LPDPFVHEYGRPDGFVPVSREVVRHLHARHDDIGLDALWCTCEHSFLQMCPMCNDVVYALAERGTFCGLAHWAWTQRIPVQWWPSKATT
jgi:hypothetical protein